MPDLGQLVVLVFGVVPGFVAAEAQAFAGFRQSQQAFENTLLALVYSAVLYVIASVGSWGPQFSPAFTDVASGQPAALLSTDLLLRYLALVVMAFVIGVATGRSLASGRLRRLLAQATGRNITESSWQEFLRDHHDPGLWIQLRDGRRLVGVPVGASDRGDERIISMVHPKWVDESGQLTSMNLQALMLDSHDSLFVGQLRPQDVPNLRPQAK
jgi:hypothetical protein